jgi:hypothetical protein
MVEDITTDFTHATVTIAGTAQYVQSAKHDEPKLEREQPDAYDIRTWRSHMHVREQDGERVVFIPAHAMQQCLVDAAKHSIGKIAGQGNKTWATKFQTGISVPYDPVLDQSPDDARMISINAHSNGVRGSGTRVTRRFPAFQDWSTSFDVWILDPIIHEAVFQRAVQVAGLFIGLGMGRPQSGVGNGRFVLRDLKWTDNRRMVA